MNQKELNEIRRRFKLDKNSISKIFGCYVNSNKEIISWIDASMGLMQQEEQEMYLGLLKKALSGALGKNLVDITFSTAQVADSDEHRLLQTMRQTELKDPASREDFCRRLIDALNMGETNYLILLAADRYDVPFRSCWLRTPTMCPTRAGTMNFRRTRGTRCTATLSAPSAR